MFKVESNGKNPYRQGTSKCNLMQWALDKGQFTRDEFLAAVKELRAEQKVTSKMSEDILGKAWWNEFKNKHKVFVAAE